MFIFDRCQLPYFPLPDVDATYPVYPERGQIPEGMSRENKMRLYSEFMRFSNRVLESIHNDIICDLTGCLDAPLP